MALLLGMLKVTVPVLVRVIVCAALAVNTGWPARLGMVEGGPKVKEAAERLASGRPPVPVRLTVCVPLGALSVKVKVAVQDPTAAGVNVTLIVQLAPAARVDVLAGQVLVWEKSPALVPPTAMLAIARGTDPVLLTVMA
jgi:hypothetical protein